MLDVLTLAAALGSGLIGGFFFAFSSTVMRALGMQPAPRGIAAMQAINVVVLNPWFLTAFMGTAALGLALAIIGALRWSDPRATSWVVGGSLYFFGTFVVTMRCNVPRNNVLAALDGAGPQAEQYWQDYLLTWTRWNHVRTVAALLAAALLTWAVRSSN
jgi:uncharacterized membrane protein